MSRMVATVVVVVLAIGLVLASYDFLIARMGFFALLAFLYSHCLDITPSLGTTVMENKGWTTVMVAGILIGVLVARLPKYGKY